MARKKNRNFSGMSYREVQRANSDRRSKIPRKDQKWLKTNGYKNVGWDSVIKLYQKINDLLIQPDPNEDSLEELFLKADRIGNKYQTPAEIATFNQKLAAEVSEIAAQVDQQFPDSEIEIIDYSQPSRKRKPKTKGKRRPQA